MGMNSDQIFPFIRLGMIPYSSPFPIQLPCPVLSFLSTPEFQKIVCIQFKLRSTILYLRSTNVCARLMFATFAILKNLQTFVASKNLKILRPPLPPPNCHLLVASLLVVINECPLDMSWAGNSSGLEVGKLEEIVPKVRNFFNIMLVFSNLKYTSGMSP